MPISLRLNSDLTKRLEIAARDSGISKSELIRQSVEDYLKRNESQTNHAWALGKDLFGKHGSGRSDVSENSEQILKEMFDAKRRNH